ncbi:MAG: substrate-binding domain-containing protein [Dictyoglomus thermophilum]|uniref:LacI family transcriptional regulator n=1 Tax=Dictyoglomus thermophilum TaxID=14 RepID=A0A7V4DY52_DICTH|nr:substrate-binding domain-containing protein [Dictyoglomus thermophilum]MCX7720053.1 substrate-binding domain-containing protein [Dictyoglomus thermophilum]
MVTIKDVAKKAGVSVMTVSRVINGSKNVKESTREKVLRTIEELGYVPNSVARSLILNKTLTIGLVISDITNPFFTTIARGVEDTAISKHFTVILCNTDEDPEKEMMYAEVLARSKVDGVIYASASGKKAPLKSLFLKKIPIVLIDRTIEGVNDLDIVRGDSVLGAYLLTKHLIDLGHRRIGIIVGSHFISTARDRVEGYKKALNEANIPIDESLIKINENSKFSKEDGYRLTKELLNLENPPTAIFGGNNLMAVGALLAIRERGLEIPEDISLVSFDDIESLSEVYPFLTVVKQPAYTMGVIATEILIRRIENRDKIKEKREILLTPELIIRKSTAPPKRKT